MRGEHVYICRRVCYQGYLRRAAGAVARQFVKEMAQTAAKTLIQIPDDQQVVVAFRLLYLPWEDTSGLPGLVIAKADRRSALSGDVKIEEQR